MKSCLLLGVLSLMCNAESVERLAIFEDKKADFLSASQNIQTLFASNCFNQLCCLSFEETFTPSHIIMISLSPSIEVCLFIEKTMCKLYFKGDSRDFSYFQGSFEDFFKVVPIIKQELDEEDYF